MSDEAPTALTLAQLKVIEAIAGRIIPATDTPGAIEAGAADYINQALADAYASLLRGYQRGIEALDNHCRAAHGESFAALDTGQQDEILENLEAGKIETVSDGARFFAMVRGHVMEGFFCEPDYGGNRDLIGWKLVASTTSA